MTVVAALTGYLIGCLPTAGWIGRLAGIDLRKSGSGNPGARNALRLGGPVVAAAVLFTEMAKGAGAAVLGLALAGEPGGVAAGLGAVAGNVYNVLYRFTGGKGLGISGGVLIALWPSVVPIEIVVIAVAAHATRSSGLASLIAIVGLNISAVIWWGFELENWWGMTPGPLLAVLSLGTGALLWRKHWVEARFSRQRRRERRPRSLRGRR